MSDTVHHSGKPPNCDGKGGRSFEIRVTKQKARLHNTGCRAVFSLGFDGTLPTTKGTVRNPIQAAEKAQGVALSQNFKALNGCILSLKTQEMTNKVIK